MAIMDFCDKHNMVAFLQKLTGSEEFYQIVDFLTGSHIKYALTANPTIYVSLIEQFWQTVTVDTINDGEQQLTVIVDGQTIAIIEAYVMRHLQLADANGISSLPNTEIFDRLTLMGYVSNDDKLTFQKGVHIPLFDTMLIHDQPGQGEGPKLTVESQHTPIASPTTSQPTTSQPMSSQEQPSQVPITEPITDSFTTSHPTQTPSPMPHDSTLSGGHTPRSDEGSKKLNELMKLCTKLSDKFTSLEDDLKQTKRIYGKALTKLVQKVKHLEAKLKSTIKRRKARMVISDDEEDLVSDETSKQGRITETKYEGFRLQQFTPTKVTQGEEQCQESSEAQLSVLSAAKILANASREKVKTYTRRSTDSSRDSTDGGLFSTTEEVQGKEQISTDKKEMARAAAREEQERIDFEKALELRNSWMKGKKLIILTRILLLNKFKKDRMSYDEIRPIFEEEYNKIQTLFKKDTEVEKTKTKRIAEETLLQESFKNLRTAEASRSEPIQEQPTEEPKELSEEELKKMMEIVLIQEIKTEALQRLFEPDKDDVLWKLQRYIYNPLTWRLYGTCGVHHVSSTRGHDIYMLIEKDYPLSTAVMNLMLSRRLQVEEDSEMAKDLIMKIFIEASKPRR
ncbi:hypothetical protein Tco_0039281 [Tanacetum coccineum]